jgi:hypothetical protein
MARPPKREMRDRTFRCLDEDFLFKAPMEYVGHDSGEELGHQVTHWVPGQARGVTCPHDPTHRIELVEE